MIPRQMFCRYEAAPGQAVITMGSSIVVPEGVWSISVVCIGTVLRRSGVDLVRARRSYRIGDGGGEGGLVPNAGAANYYVFGGSGAGGYTGNGGAGGLLSGSGDDWVGTDGGAGSGGGGGGGGGGALQPDFPPSPPIEYLGGAGGGVGLLGMGTNGAGGYGGGRWYQGGPGGAGSPTGTVYGGGRPGRYGYTLSWANNIAVTPGETLTTAYAETDLWVASDQGGATRIMWGGGRSYPSNAGNM